MKSLSSPFYTACTRRECCAILYKRYEDEIEGSVALCLSLQWRKEQSRKCEKVNQQDGTRVWYVDHIASWVPLITGGFKKLLAEGSIELKKNQPNTHSREKMSSRSSLQQIQPPYNRNDKFPYVTSSKRHTPVPSCCLMWDCFVSVACYNIYKLRRQQEINTT